MENKPYICASWGCDNKYEGPITKCPKGEDCGCCPEKCHEGCAAACKREMKEDAEVAER